jgi:peptide/nickel transport system permease protein
MVLPLLTLLLLSFGETMLLMRTTMIDVLGNDHVLTARAKGVPDSDVRDKHVARLALLPVLTHFIIHLPYVIIGSFVVEKIFSWRGLGQALFDAADFYDLPVLMGILSVSGIFILSAHLVLDIMNAWLDPRVRTDQFQLMKG